MNRPLTTCLAIKRRRQALPHALCQDGCAPKGGSRRSRWQGWPNSPYIAVETLHPQSRRRVHLRIKGGRQYGGEEMVGRRKSEAEDKEVDWQEWRGQARSDSGRGEKQKIDFMATAGVVPYLLVQQKTTLSIQVIVRCNFQDCEAFNVSLSNVNLLCDALPWMRQPLLLNRQYFK